MKKIISLLLAVTVLFASVSFAEDLSALTDDVLMELYLRVTEEMALREMNAGEEAGESFRDAVDVAGESAYVAADPGYLVVVGQKDGVYYRKVAVLDGRARELYAAALAEEDSGSAIEAFDAYAWSLPVSYTEELAGKPKDQAELDALAGKTVGELLEEGYSFYALGGIEGSSTVVNLSCGLFVYDFETDAPFEVFLEREGWDGLESLEVNGRELSGSFILATNLDYLADGTYHLRLDPGAIADEAPDADGNE